MCGISGYISKKHIDTDTLRMMNDSMIHRGPDDEGVEIYEMHGPMQGYSVGFAQRRLSIIDLSPMGHQPMHSADKRVSIVYNGIIIPSFYSDSHTYRNSFSKTAGYSSVKL